MTSKDVKKAKTYFMDLFYLQTPLENCKPTLLKGIHSLETKKDLAQPA